ncbi:unnamed protein product [Symbiodinium necroappetens]|uniref:DEAD/DEAH-box helicase domain-containing protein n=1 Tax=Symbiodinium necroappetens TaxID=1628268 RepID=A0A813BLR2_9DINO|nr:unnamed protein product [Symbiodinium necroappetens]
MNAVPIRQDVTDAEKQEATQRAKAQWEKMGRTASWGCAWYKRWFDLVCAAVEKKQRLKAVFFPGQVGYGIPTMEDLSDCEVDLWDGVGCGGSQKSELATANLMQKQHPGWDYEEVDVTAFLKNQFPLGAPVDALHETEADSRWRRGIVVKQMEKVSKTESGDESTEFVWQIKCDDDSGDIFETGHVRHLNVAVEYASCFSGRVAYFETWDILEPALRQCLADVKLRHPTACRLRSGTPALSIGIQIPNVESLLALRDRVLSGDFDRSVNEGLALGAPEFKVKGDKSRLFELYEDSLLGLKELTEHQQVKLKEMEGLDDVHLSAPAGAGKTFVAVQHVLEHLNSHPSARLLYVAPSGSLGLHFIRWLSMRLASRTQHSEPGLVQSRIQQVLSRMTLLHSPFKHFQLPSLDGDRILRRVAEPGTEEYDMVVYDEGAEFASASVQAKQENIVLDTVENADGLEQLVVVCVGLDAPIQRHVEDIQTRSRLYRGLTRAQLLAIVVNERVQGGWLEFLGMVTFSESSDEAVAEKESVQSIQKAAAKVHEEALQTVVERHAEDHGAPAGASAVAGASQTVGDDHALVKSAQPDHITQPPRHETSTAFGLQSAANESLFLVQVWDTSGNTMSKPTSLLFNPFFSTDEVVGPCTLRPTDPLLSLCRSVSLSLSLSLSLFVRLCLSLSLPLSLSLSLPLSVLGAAPRGGQCR